MFVIENETDHGFTIYVLIIGAGLCVPFLLDGTKGEWVFLAIVGLLCILSGLFSWLGKIYGKQYIIDENGITISQHKKKETFSYDELGYYLYRVDRPYLRQHPIPTENHYIHIYNKNRKEVFVLMIPEEIEPNKIIGFLSLYLKKYSYGG